jgi:hypothetical protein
MKNLIMDFDTLEELKALKYRLVDKENLRNADQSTENAE